MSQTIQLSDELYRALERYAQEHQQTPEEALASLLQSTQHQVESDQTGSASGSEHPLQIVKAASEDTSEYLDPWEGFRGKFEAKYPDLIQRHDYYIGQQALDTHADEDE